VTLVTPLPDTLDDIAALPLRRTPGEIAAFGLAVAAVLRGGAATDPGVAATAQALAAAQAPLVVAGAGLGDAAIVEAAAAVARALGSRARLALFPGEANALGLALLGGSGIGAAAGLPGAVIVLENDLFERADPAQVDALFAGRTVIALDCIDTATTARADIVLPVASFDDAAGSFINHEGRAQRFFAARAGGAPAAWRVLAALGGGAELGLDALHAALARDCPQLAGIADAAPRADYVTPLGPIARAPARFSGRTASDRAGRVAAAVPPADPDSPLSWTMEGQAFDALPAGLFDGTRLFVAGDGSTIPEAPPVTPIAGDGLILIPLHDPFRGNETDAASVILGQRAPDPRLLLHPDDAAALGLGDGAAVLADGRAAPRVTIDAAVPRGHVALTTLRTDRRRIRLERVS
jgi:NADH-quinone oxidoreductase subunit G